MTIKTRAKKRSSPVRSSSRLPFEIVLPATSANLGPAFDAGAIALNLFLRVRATVSRDYSITAAGRDEDICGRLENNLIVETYKSVLRSQGKADSAIAVRVENGIPIGKGCGSSAAARLAGIALAVHFGKLSWDGDRVLAEASRLEHHADNAAACWLGGLTVARMANASSAQAVRLNVNGKWPLLLAIPEKSLSTEKARLALPAQYGREDVVANIQNAMFLLAALTQGNSGLLSAALEDRIHQPYRAALCPLLPALQQLHAAPGILGVALSGAGPSVLIFVDPETGIAGVKTRIETHLREAGLSAEIVAAAITTRGGNSLLPR